MLFFDHHHKHLKISSNHLLPTIFCCLICKRIWVLFWLYSIVSRSKNQQSQNFFANNFRNGLHPNHLLLLSSSILSTWLYPPNNSKSISFFKLTEMNESIHTTLSSKHKYKKLSISKLMLLFFQVKSWILFSSFDLFQFSSPFLQILYPFCILKEEMIFLLSFPSFFILSLKHFFFYCFLSFFHLRNQNFRKNSLFLPIIWTLKRNSFIFCFVFCYFLSTKSKKKNDLFFFKNKMK